MKRVRVRGQYADVIRRFPSFVVFFVTVCGVVSSSAQPPATGALPVVSAAASSITVPPAFQSKVSALGNRFTSPGKERLTVTGSISRAGGTTPVTVTYEIPRKFSYQENGKSIVYDGTSTSLPATASASDTAISESLFEDMVDGLFPNIQKAPLFRLLMNRARLDDGRAKVYTGPYLDIYQIILPLGSLPNTPKRMKHVYFDTNTHLLDRVRYLGGVNGQTQVETLCQQWQEIDGAYVPTKISRSENGVVQFTLTAASTSVSPAKTDATFSH